VAGLVAIDPPADAKEMPAFLNLERIAPFPALVALLAPRPVQVRTQTPSDWSWCSQVGRALTGATWPEIVKPAR
jgi:hypothetical protein